MKSIVRLFFLFIALNASLFSQGNEYNIGNTVQLKSNILGEERQLIINLPPGYNQGSAVYPVLYLLDGNAHFHYASGIVNYLSGIGRIPQMIVVAIPNVDRGRDFTPTKSGEIRNSGGADNFLSFLKDELIPFIDENYRTQPYRVLFGHSLTGMFSLYTFLNAPDLFGAYIAASAYLMYDNDYIVKLAETKQAKALTRKILYMTVGNEPEYFASFEKLKKIFNEKSPENFHWKHVKHEADDHGTITVKTINEGIQEVYDGWRLPADFVENGSADLLKKHFENLSGSYGYKINAPEAQVNILGYQTMAAGRMETAIELFEYNVELYPESANVYDSLGEGLEAAGKLELAKENYERALKLGKEKDDPNLNFFKEHLENIQKRMVN